jgi:peptidoglycan/LPS O-acetylase OafA/YrhL
VSDRAFVTPTFAESPPTGFDVAPEPPRQISRTERVLRFLEPNRGSRFAALDGCRAIAALGVVVYHVAGYEGLTAGDSLGARFTNNLGNFGVAIFFLLSGFLLYRPFVMTWFRNEPTPGVVVYLRRRFLRIFPAYWLALGAFIALGLFKANNPNPAYYATLFSLTQIYRPAFGFAGLSVAWTLCIEISFYLALPIIAYGIRLIGTRAHTTRMKLEAQLLGLTVMAIVALGYRFMFAGPWQFDDVNHKFTVVHLWIFNYLDWFALGMLLAVCVCWTDMGKRLPRAFQRLADSPWLCWIMAAASYFMLMMVRHVTVVGANGIDRETTAQMFLRFFFNGAAAFFFLLPTVIGSTQTSVIHRALATLTAMYLGTVSYGIYLWHKIWLDYLKVEPPPGKVVAPIRFSFWPMLGLVVLLAVITASLSYYLLERPIMKFKESTRRSSAKSTAAA